MRHMALGALSAVMILDDDLFEPRRAGLIGFVAPDAMAAGGLVRRDVWVVAMLPAHAVAGLAGKRLVRIRRPLVQDVGVTFITRLLARQYGWPRRNKLHSLSAIPAVLTK